VIYLISEFYFSRCLVIINNKVCLPPRGQVAVGSNCWPPVTSCQLPVTNNQWALTTISISISISAGSCPTSCLQLAPIAAQQRKAIKSRSAHQLGCSAAAAYQIFFNWKLITESIPNLVICRVSYATMGFA